MKNLNMKLKMCFVTDSQRNLDDVKAHYSLALPGTHLWQL